MLYDFKVHELLIQLLDTDCDLTKVKVCQAIQYMIINTCLAQEIANKSLIAAFTSKFLRKFEKLLILRPSLFKNDSF